jgi:hypothetical protein
MNRQWVSVVSVLALVVLAAPTSGVVSPTVEQSNNTSLGTEISSFMQVSSVEAEGDVDRGMFEAELAAAPNESVRQRLLERRAAHLESRLGDVRQSVEAAKSGDGSRRTVAQTVANARVDALERSVVNVETFSQQSGVSPPGLSDLRDNVRGLREPSVPPVIDTGDDIELGAPSAGEGGDGVSNPGVPNAGGESDQSGESDGPAVSNGGDLGNGEGEAGVAGGVDVSNDDAVDGPVVEQSSNQTTTDDANALGGPVF